MRIVSLINGSLLSESASQLALNYAGSVQLPFTALFIDNGNESIERVRETVSVLQAQAEALQIEFEFVQLEGDVIEQLQHYCQLYAVETLFCATRQNSKLRSFSEKIIHAKIETNIAVVKIKNVAHSQQPQRLLLLSKEQINPHVYVLWLGLIKAFCAYGRIHFAVGKGFSHASSKSGLKYHAAPFMQLATLAGIAESQVHIANSVQKMDVETVHRYLVEHDVDLLMMRNDLYSKQELNDIGDESSANSIIIYPWEG